MAAIATKFDTRPKYNGPSPDFLKATFETSVMQIHRDNNAPRPIVVRPRLSIAPGRADERALGNAARALAQLWNVQPARATGR